jgi:hypothetical protein
MIVRVEASSLLLITQPDHAALARRVMDAWVADELLRQPRRDSILHAIEEHDNGWREVDVGPIVDERSGRILDFVTAPADVRQSVWPRGVGRLAADPAAAALVAQHAMHLYRRYRSDPAWTGFLSALENLRARHAAGAGLTLEEVARDYAFLEIADLMSLTFCNAWTEEQRTGRYTIQLVGSSMMVRPDPFGGRTVEMSLRARELPNGGSWSAAEALSTFRSAPEIVISGRVSGG